MDKQIEGDLTTSLYCDGVVRVSGSILGKGEVRCFAEKSVDCVSVRGATLISGGDITASCELAEARVCAAGVLRVGGAIVGGKSSGNGGILCETAGSAAGLQTTLACGVDIHFHTHFARRRLDIDRDFTLARRTRAQVTPQLDRLRNLSPKERESVTVTLYEADELARAAKAAIEVLAADLRRSRTACRTQVDVSGMLYANVTIKLGNLTATVTGAAGRTANNSRYL